MLQTIQYGKATKDRAVWSMDAIVPTESKSFFSFGSSKCINGMGGLMLQPLGSKDSNNRVLGPK